MKVKKFRCEGGEGCGTPGCELIAKGKPQESVYHKESLYMCPYNHWRSCKWVEMEIRCKSKGTKCRK